MNPPNIDEKQEERPSDGGNSCSQVTVCFVDGYSGAPCANRWPGRGACGGKGTAGRPYIHGSANQLVFSALADKAVIPATATCGLLCSLLPVLSHHKKFTAGVSQEWVNMAVGASCPVPQPRQALPAGWPHLRLAGGGVLLCHCQQTQGEG